MDCTAAAAIKLYLVRCFGAILDQAEVYLDLGSIFDMSNDVANAKLKKNGLLGLRQCVFIAARTWLTKGG